MFFVFNREPDFINIRVIVVDMIKNNFFVFEGKTGVNIKKTVSVAGDKINILILKIVFGADGLRDIAPPLLGSFGVIEPRTG